MTFFVSLPNKFYIVCICLAFKKIPPSAAVKRALVLRRIGIIVSLQGENS